MKKPIAFVTLAVVAAGTAISVPALAAGTARIKVADDKFIAKQITVKRGARVVWNWVGKQPHNVTVTKGPRKFASKTFVKGRYVQVLTKPGTYQIVCTIHAAEGMKMTVVVK